MRILLVNTAAEVCGGGQHGRLFAEAMRRRGHIVFVWHPDRPREHPAVDFCFVNWLSMPNVGPHSLPPGVPVACFYHETHVTNNRARCPFWTTADLLFTSEPVAREGARREPVCVPFPCPDVVPTVNHPDRVVIGSSTIHHLYTHHLEEICRNTGWELNTSQRGRWLSVEDEVNRLAASTVVCFVRNNFDAGQSAGVGFALAARRPMVLNHCRQFFTFFDHEDEIYFADPGGDMKAIERVIREALADIEACREKRPLRLARERSWSAAAEVYERHMLEVLR